MPQLKAVLVSVSDGAYLQESGMGEEHETGAETQPGGLSRKPQLHTGTEPPG